MQNIFSIQNLIIYLIVINIIGFFIMFIDKRRAKMGYWRIPENTIFVVTAIGGGIGTIAGMYIFRHKTKKLRFKVGLPFLLIMDILFIIWFFINFIGVNSQNKNEISGSNIINESEEDDDFVDDNIDEEDAKVNAEEQYVYEGDYFVLYKGYEMKKETGVQFLSDMNYTKQNKAKYNRKYYNYENSKNQGEKDGNVQKTYGSSEEEYSGSCVVQNVSRIAISDKYNAVPRSVKRENSLPDELIDMSDYPSVAIDSVDLDGDGTLEHVVCWRVSYKENEIGNGDPQESSGMMLFDSNYKKVADLVELKNGFVGNSLEEFKNGNMEAIELEDVRSYIDLDSTEYIDIDNDSIMEIIISIPVYEGEKISVLKYNKGTITGETGIEATVKP